MVTGIPAGVPLRVSLISISADGIVTGSVSCSGTGGGVGGPCNTSLTEFSIAGCVTGIATTAVVCSLMPSVASIQLLQDRYLHYS